MGKCRNCKYWWKGEKIHYSETSRDWSGYSLHPKAGTTETKRDWDKIPKFGGVADSGKCMDVNRLATLLVHIDDGNDIITKGGFGCNSWKHDQGKDKYSHTYIDSRGQQSLNEYVSDMKLQPDFGDPVGIKWTSINTGWLFYKDPDPIACEPELVPAVTAHVVPNEDKIKENDTGKDFPFGI